MSYLFIAMAAQAAAPFTVGHWTVTSRPDPISDHAEVDATLRGDAGTLSFMCSVGERSTLIVRPDRFLGGPLSRYELRDTWVRFDDRPATRVSWKYVDTYAVPYSEREMFELLAAARDAATLTIRLTSYDNSSVDVVFDLAGSAEAIAEARRHC